MPTPAATSPPRRVLLITRNLPPVIGGMERLIGHVADILGRRFDLAVVGPRGGRCGARRYLACPLAPLWLFLVTAAVKGVWAALVTRPRLVVAGSGLVAPVARLAALLARVPCAVYVHGLDIAATHRLYRLAFLPAIRKADLVLANSRYTARRVEEAGIPRERITVLPPGVTVPASVPERTRAAIAFHELHALPAGPILLAVGRLTPRKGLADFTEQVLPRILSTIPDAQLVIAGEVPRFAAKRTGDEADAVRRAARKTTVETHIHLIGPLDDNGLACAWPAAEVHVFPVRDDAADPEGFGMVALEAAAWGVPTVAFAAGGVSDAVADGASGFLVTPGDYERFAERVLEAVAMRTTFATAARRFAADFQWPMFEERLVRMLVDLQQPHAADGAQSTSGETAQTSAVTRAKRRR